MYFYFHFSIYFSICTYTQLLASFFHYLRGHLLHLDKGKKMTNQCNSVTKLLNICLVSLREVF